MYNICIAYVAYAVALVFLRPHNIPRQRTVHGNGAARLVKPCFGSLTISAARNGTSMEIPIDDTCYLCVSVTYYICIYLCL